MTNVIVKEPDWEDRYDLDGKLIDKTPKEGDMRWKKYSIRKVNPFWGEKLLKNQAWLERYDAKTDTWKRLPIEYDTHYV